MIKRLLTRQKHYNREKGFSLVEIMISLGVVGILAAIVIPLYIQSQNEINSASIKADMQTAATLIEQEQIDNNGLYPTYFPNELKENERMKTFVYTYSTDRTRFCIQAPSPLGKLYISSQIKEVTNTPCTEEHIGKNSVLPWAIPTINTPTINTVTNTWASNENASKSTIKVNPTTCTLAAEDVSEWGPKTKVEYLTKITNTNITGDNIHQTPWSQDTTITTTLPPDWLPEHKIKHETEARCLITNGGLGYPYTSSFSLPKEIKVATFVVTPANFTTTTANWENNTKFTTKAVWADAYCPSGTKMFTLAVKDTKTNALMPKSTETLNWTTEAVSSINIWSSEEKTQFSHTVRCKLTDNRIISSAPTIKDVTNPIQPPSPLNVPPGLRRDITPTTTVLPTHIFFPHTSTCPSGTVSTYNLRRTAPNTVTTSVALNSSPLHGLVIGNTYTYDVSVACYRTSTGEKSIFSPPSPSVTFVAEGVGVAAPVAPTARLLNISEEHYDTSAGEVKWGKVDCKSDNDSYIVRRISIDGNRTSDSSGWISGYVFDIPSDWLQNGSEHVFTVQAKCTRPSTGESQIGLPTANISAILGIPTPSAPKNLFKSTAGSTLRWDEVGCERGTTPIYTVYEKMGTTEKIVKSNYTLYALMVNVTPGHKTFFTVSAACQGNAYSSRQSPRSNETFILMPTKPPTNIDVSRNKMNNQITVSGACNDGSIQTSQSVRIYKNNGARVIDFTNFQFYRPFADPEPQYAWTGRTGYEEWWIRAKATCSTADHESVYAYAGTPNANATPW